MQLAKPDLEAVLNAVWELIYCRKVDRKLAKAALEGGPHHCDLGPILGELDWHKELCALTGKGSTVEDPNLKQVGGEHYRKDGYTFQHWDLCAELLGPAYFEGQITKYVARWRGKEGVRDVEKALHYLDKLIWLYHNDKFPAVRLGRTGAAYSSVSEYSNLHGLVDLEHEIFLKMFTYRTAEELKSTRCLIEELLSLAQGNTEPEDKP